MAGDYLFFHALCLITDPGDYFGQSQDGTVQSLGSRTCLSILIENDDIPESCEDFSVSLSFPGANISPRTVVIRSEPLVTILDDEGADDTYHIPLI